MKTVIATTIFSTLVLNAPANAADNQCSLQFKDDLVITASEVRLQRAEQDLWRIDSRGNLWLAGNSVTTDPATQRNLVQYQAGLRHETHAVVDLVTDALALAATAVDKVVTNLGGENPQLQDAVAGAIGNLRQHIETLVVKNDGEIRIHGSKIQNADGEIEQEFEQAIEQSVMQLTGAMMISLGQSMSSGQGDFDSRMQAFGEKMEKFGQELEAEMTEKSERLAGRAERICAELHDLDGLEQQIQRSIPAMKSYDLIDTSKDGFKSNMLSASK